MDKGIFSIQYLKYISTSGTQICSFTLAKFLSLDGRFYKIGYDRKITIGQNWTWPWVGIYINEKS